MSYYHDSTAVNNTDDWIYIDPHVACLITHEYSRYVWILWDGDKKLEFNGADSKESAEYAAWSWYVDWCYEHCPIRLEYLR